MRKRASVRQIAAAEPRARIRRRAWVAAAAALCALAALGAPRRASACAACNCGDSTLTVTGLEKPYKNRVRVGLDERVGESTAGDDRSWTLRSALHASWSPHPRVTVAAMLPWVTTWLDEPGRPTSLISGLGDLELALRVIVYRDRAFAPRHLLWLTGGLKFPTGPRLRDDTGHPFSDDDQPGSGSWDPFTALSYGWFGGLVSLFASTSYRYTTPGPRGYRRGSVLAVSTAAQVAPWSWGALVLGVDGVWTAPDTLPNGVDMPNTGSVSLHLVPSLLATPARDLLLRLAIDIPAANAFYGQQSAGTQVLLSIVYDIH
jgi:hypothetical protein